MKIKSDLLDVVPLPEELAICKYEAHTNNTDSVSTGNTREDAKAKRAA